MIGGHQRLGFAVLGGVVLALVAVLVLLLGRHTEIDTAGPDPNLVAPVTPEAGPEARAATGPATADQPSRSGARGPVGVDVAWAAATGAKAGIPTTAMRAYADAELALRRERRSCHLSWNTLAGIGWVESQHGTIDGRTLLDDGRSEPPVIGPALDGKAFAAIRSTPSSAAWHGDATWEHAVGPMQFIGSTWEKWGADGDADGVEDPLDLDDAALATAHYLCADAHDLATASGWNAAVHSFNHDQAYVVQVLNAANSYAQRVR